MGSSLSHKVPSEPRWRNEGMCASNCNCKEMYWWPQDPLDSGKSLLGAVSCHTKRWVNCNTRNVKQVLGKMYQMWCASVPWSLLVVFWVIWGLLRIEPRALHMLGKGSTT
jgi:hypothetical protein